MPDQHGQAGGVVLFVRGYGHHMVSGVWCIIHSRAAGGIASLLIVMAACGGNGVEAETSLTAVDAASTVEAVGTSEPTSPPVEPDDGDLLLLPITSELLTSAGVEAVGCWFSEGDGTDGETVFFSGYDGGFFMTDGALIQVDKPEGKSFGVERGLVYSNADFEAQFSVLGEPVSSSIESTEQSATLEITPANAATVEFEGTLWCGV